MSSARLDFPERFEEVIGRPLKRFVSLKEHAHFKIGGQADYFFAASSLSEIIKVVRFARESGVPYRVIGGGYNLLFADEGFRGLIIKNCVEGMKQKEGEKIEALSGTPLQDAVQFCVEKELKGFEFLAGIPGTVGGAVFGNAGAFEQAIGNLLTRALLLDANGEEVEVGHDAFGFDYRSSRLRSSRELLLKAVFVLESGKREEIAEKIGLNLEKRRSKHPPWNMACAGSYFKNPVFSDGKRVAAAYLLDQVEAKNLSMGGAAVFGRHANFIVNREGATARDVLNLARELKDRVKKKFGVDLEEEVIFLPARPSSS